MKVVKIVGIIAVVVAAGIALGWLGSRKPSQGPQTATSTPSTPAPTATPAAPPNVVPGVTRGTNRYGQTPKVPRIRSTNTTAQLAVMSASAGSTNLVANWEDRVDEILVADVDESAKAKQMLALFPRLPEDGQEEVAQHLANLVPDEDYGALGSYLTNTALPEAVLDVLLADALNRPNSVKLPLLLQVARNQLNPKAAEAKDLLELFLEENPGDDWSQWQARIDQWLRDNPD